VLAAKDTHTATGHRHADLTANSGATPPAPAAESRFSEKAERAKEFLAAVAAAGSKKTTRSLRHETPTQIASGNRPCRHSHFAAAFGPNPRQFAGSSAALPATDALTPTAHSRVVGQALAAESRFGEIAERAKEFLAAVAVAD
jgi:hypothetical protein